MCSCLALDCERGDFVLKRNLQIASIVLLAVICIVHSNLSIAAKKTSLKFSKSVSRLEVGSNFSFKVRGVKNGGKAIEWSTSNPKVAKINKKGKLTALRKGTVTVKAVIMKDGSVVMQNVKVVKKQDSIANPVIPAVSDPEIQIIPELPAEESSDSVYEELGVESDSVQNLTKEAGAGPMDFPAIGFTDCNSINNFNYSVFQRAVVTEEQNPLVSPLSVYLALALVSEGAEGETKQQFDTILGRDQVSTRIHQLTDSLAAVTGSTKLSIADSIWIDDQFEASTSWLSRMVSLYNAEIFQTDLCKDAARIGMNNWVSNKTRGLIPVLFNQNLSEEMRMVLMNTIYLKAKWLYKFEANNTYAREFTNEDGKVVSPYFLNDYKVYRRYFETEEADGIVLPYDDGRLAMIAIRPQSGQTARELAQNLTAQKIAEYLKESKETSYVNLHFPKFTLDYTVVMNDLLQQLGLEDAFSPEKANFNSLGNEKGSTEADLFISQVLQKVKVRVDEEGTEAAAVTAIMMTNCAAIAEDEKIPIEVDFNEPFVYVIADTKTPFGAAEEVSVPLFMGVVTELYNWDA